MADPRALRVLLACGRGELERAVRDAGHDVHLAPDDASAVAAARALALDVAVLDLGGCADPFAVARGVRAGSPWHKPMVVGLADAGQCEECCRDAGIDLLLFKPGEAGLLLGVLRRLRAVLDDLLAFDPVI